MFSCHPIVNIPVIEPYLKEGHVIQPDIETLQHVGLERNAYFKLVHLAQFLGQRITGVEQEAGITVIKRVNRREYAETEELAERLKGFSLPVRVVQLEKMHFAEQVTALRNTRILIAPHGAGTVNQMFMPRGGKIIELFPKGYSNWHAKAMADAFGHELVEIESDKLGIYGREPSEEARKCIEKNGWPDTATMRSRATSSVKYARILLDREFGRVMRDVHSYSIAPERVIKVLVKMLLS